MALEIFLNGAQARLAYDRLPVVATGLQFRTEFLSGVWFCPVKNVVTLYPKCLSAFWATSNAGDYQKLAKADYTLADATKWEDRQDQALKGPWVCTKDSEYNAAAVVTTVPGKNRAQYLAWYAFGEGSDFIQMECGWGGAGVFADATVALKFWSGGKVDVYKNNVYQGSGNYSGGKGGKSTSGTLVQVFLLPWCVRELLIYSISAGDGFSHVFEDIDSTDTDPTIVPASAFWWKVPVGATQVMCAPAKFQTTGYVSSEKLSFFEAPLGTDVLETWDNSAWTGAGTDYKVYGDPAFAGTVGLTAELRNEGDTGSFTADGLTKPVRIRMNLTGDGNYAPMAYGAQFAYSSVLWTTDDVAEQEISSKITSLEFSVGEGASETDLQLTVNNPYELEALAPGFLSQTNLPLRMEWDGVVWMDGRTGPFSEEMDTYDEAGYAPVTVRDGWQSLENYLFVEQFPLDDVLFTDAITALVQAGGFTGAEIVLSASTYRFPKIVGENADDWNILIKSGDTPADWIPRLFEDYASDWIYGFKPTATGIIFYGTSPDDMMMATDLTLYMTIEDAITIGGFTEDEAWKYVVRKYKRVPVPLEANDIRVSGEDPVTGRLIQSYKSLTDSIDPTIVPADRIPNWIGEIRRAGLYNNSLTTQADTDWACDLLANRLFNAGALVEFTCEILRDLDGVPYWKGDVIEIYGKGAVRILTFGFDLLLIDGTYVITEVNYTAEEVTLP